ncbi:MAG TPA: hypothetical protein VMS77_04090 [Conexivisphaerales archaeon]|nr:hypothetical protein [Conexivisphaerales archaeon]
MTRRAVGQIYAMAIMLALMISTLLVGLGMEQGVLRSVQGNMNSIQQEQQRELEKLSVSQDGPSLAIRNVGTVTVTLAFIHTNSSDVSLGQVLQPGSTWTGSAVGSSTDYVVTSLGNVFSADPSSVQPVETLPSNVSLLYSPMVPRSYFVLYPLYSSSLGVTSKAEPSGSSDWTVAYPADYQSSPTSLTTMLLPTADPNYTLFCTEYYYGTYFASITPFRLQAPQAQKVLLNSSGPILFKSGQAGFLATDIRYAQPNSTYDYFWYGYRPITSNGTLLTTYDPGAFPARNNERFQGSTVEESNGTFVAEFGFGDSYSYETTGTFPTTNAYPYSSMFIRLLKWNSTGLSSAALYNVSSNYPAFPYLAEDPAGWANSSCVYGNTLAVRVAMRSPTNAYVLLDVYSLDTGKLQARKLLFNGTYTSNMSPYKSFHLGFLDSDRLVLQDDLHGTVQVLSIAGNLSASASISSLPSALKLGGAVPLVASDYTTITDFYLVPGTGLVYPTYAGAYFYDCNLTLYKTIAFDSYEPQPKSSNPVVLVSNSTVVALVVAPDGSSYVKVFGP